jgi:hypothetical protein
MPDDLTPDELAVAKSLAAIRQLAWQMGGSPLNGQDHPHVAAIRDWCDGIEATHAAAIREAEARGERRGAAAEREACALVAEEKAVRYLPLQAAVYHAVDAVAAAIRKRGESPP